VVDAHGAPEALTTSGVPEVSFELDVSGIVGESSG